VKLRVVGHLPIGTSGGFFEKLPGLGKLSCVKEPDGILERFQLRLRDAASLGRRCCSCGIGRASRRLSARSSISGYDRFWFDFFRHVGFLLKRHFQPFDSDFRVR
jgi:hypothetical protein